MTLKYVASYLLATVCGNENPSKSDIENILGSVGSDVDSDVLDAFMSAVAGKLVHETISSGLTKLQSVPAGGAVLVSSTSAAASAEDSKAPDAKKDEPEEEDDDMGFSLFD